MENKQKNINNSFDDEKFIKMLFDEYQKSYNETKQGQIYPQWFNEEQLKWILIVAKKHDINCIKK